MTTEENNEEAESKSRWYFKYNSPVSKVTIDNTDGADGTSTVYILPPVAEDKLLSSTDQYNFLRKQVIEALTTDYYIMYTLLLGNKKFESMTLEDKIMEVIRIDRFAIRNLIDKIKETDGEDYNGTAS